MRQTLMKFLSRKNERLRGLFLKNPHFDIGMLHGIHGCVWLLISEELHYVESHLVITTLDEESTLGCLIH